MALSRVELFERIRRDRREDPQVSVSALAKPYGVHRRTVRDALVNPAPRERKKPPPRRSILEPAHGWIDEMLREDMAAPRRQKHTNVRIYQRLITKYGFRVASLSTVRDYVAQPETADHCRGACAGLAPGRMVPQMHLPGEEAEVTGDADPHVGEVTSSRPGPSPTGYALPSNDSADHDPRHHPKPLFPSRETERA